MRLNIISKLESVNAVIGVDLRAPTPLEAGLGMTYGPVVELLVRNLARVAAR